MVQVEDHFSEGPAIENIDNGQVLVSFEVVQDDGDGHLQLLLNILLDSHYYIICIYIIGHILNRYC